MNITNIIRGDDHISNTPRQILLIEAWLFNTKIYTHTINNFFGWKEIVQKKADVSILNCQGYIFNKLIYTRARGY